MCLGAAYFLGGSFWPFLSITVGFLAVLWGHLPNLFARQVEAQLIQGTPYQRKESPWRWTIAVTVAVCLAGLASLLYRKYVPQKPDIHTIVREAALDAFNRINPSPPPLVINDGGHR